MIAGQCTGGWWIHATDPSGSWLRAVHDLPGQSRTCLVSSVETFRSSILHDPSRQLQTSHQAFMNMLSKGPNPPLGSVVQQYLVRLVAVGTRHHHLTVSCVWYESSRHHSHQMVSEIAYRRWCTSPWCWLPKLMSDFDWISQDFCERSSMLCILHDFSLVGDWAQNTN